MLTLRIGAEQREESVSDTRAETDLVTKFTAGVGLNFGSFRFDYAYKQNQLFNELSTNYFSLCYVGDIFEKSKSAEEAPVSVDYEKMMQKGNE